ncbi:hypothetical protein COPCOM_03054 [Coprococcus comes ATCC 27758]|uniref:Uncharacterized protein n=1 Tax=Coprococcus comes ATCC 27758 TaxID=470146 RepID=C0BD13_9FIRM|nr:hypothetical protein COPCOM_03054 [Coprococcus comes ATCC 27758]
MPPREFKYNKEMKNRSYNHRKSRIDFLYIRIMEDPVCSIL